MVSLLSSPFRYEGNWGIDTYYILLFMTQSHNGEATHGRDAEKYRENHDGITFTKDSRPEYTGKEVAKEDLPAGMRCRIVYGKKD